MWLNQAERLASDRQRSPFMDDPRIARKRTPRERNREVMRRLHIG
jgi:hypothetical protein